MFLSNLVLPVIHWVLLLRALFLRALDFRAPSFIVNKGCVIGKKKFASEFLLSISAYFTFAHTHFTCTIYFCDLRVKGVPSVFNKYILYVVYECPISLLYNCYVLGEICKNMFGFKTYELFTLF